MRLSLLKLYWLRTLGAFFALVCAIVYLAGLERTAALGFTVLALAVTVIAVRINRNSLPATCDLCDAPATIGAEYDAGFANARLILHCQRCGRVINSRPGSMKPQKE